MSIKKNIIVLVSFLFGLSTLPSILILYAGASSMALGLFIALLPVFLYSISNFEKVKISKNEIIFISLITTFVIAHLLFSSIFFYGKISAKQFASILLAIFIILQASVTVNYMHNKNKFELNNSIVIIFYLLLSLLVWKAFSVSILAKYATDKKMLLFEEPSHFSLIYSIFITYYMVNEKGAKLTVLLVSVISALIIKSLALLLVCVMAYFCYLIVFKGKFLLIFAALVLVASVIISIRHFDPNYFLERLVITRDSQNLSVLVFLSGFERALLVSRDTFFLGAGFQSMGNLNIYGEIQEKIFEISGSHLNLYDGGTLAAKLIFEFGAFGIFLIFIYLIYILKNIRKFFLSRDVLDKFLWCAFVCLFFSFFVRGVGYFSPSVLFSLCFILRRVHYGKIYYKRCDRFHEQLSKIAKPNESL
ncbi:hypothetical protein [Marinobacter sp.]|uniref:hypothetical protein n=1 Tax=Marinobacter sp. TaxID=50741 RepID=UPI0035C67D58